MTGFRNPRRVLHHLYRTLGNGTQAQIVWAIWYWRPKARVTRDGQLWVVKTDDDLCEDGVTAPARTIRAALTALERLSLISRTRGPHPNGRAPNARYLWIDDTLFDELEAIAREDVKRGRLDTDECEVAPKSCDGHRRVEVEARAASARSYMPHEGGNSRRFHRQVNNNTTNNKTITTEERPLRGKSRKGIGLSGRRRNTPSKASQEISADLAAAIHAAFDEGCRTRVHQPCRAPLPDTQDRVNRIAGYAHACRVLGLSEKDTCEAAALFAHQYCPDRIAAELGKSRVSHSPNFHVLAMCANIAVSDFVAARTLQHTEQNSGSRFTSARSANELFSE